MAKVKEMLPAELDGEQISPEELRQVEVFRDVDLKVLQKFPGAVVRRRFEAGDVICREGEGGTTAFYILRGSVRIFISRRSAGTTTHNKSSGGLLASIGRWFGQKQQATHTAHDDDKLVPIDASVDLRYGDLATTIGAGEIFGEMSCLNLAPRSATVVAEGECEMLEILRNVYEKLQNSPTFRQRMDERYRSNALAGHLRNVALFEGMKDEDVEWLRQKAELLRIPAGTVLFKQGDAADDPASGGMYLIRLGQIKVSHNAPGGERTLAYLSKGDCFGETGLLRRQPRNATCTAVDHPFFEDDGKRDPAHVELVRLTPDLLEAILEKYPRIKGRLEALGGERVRDQQRRAVTVELTVQTKRVEDLGLRQGQNLMLIDLTRCTRCDQCVDACVSVHDDGMPRLIREGPRFDNFLVPSSCRMCMDPVCMIGCPVGSIRRTEDLNIFIEDWCIGCGLCASQCPYDSIQMHDLERFGQEANDKLKRVADGGQVVTVTERAVVCDQCSSLPTGPACVYACPHDAALRVNAVDFLQAAKTSAEARN